MRLAACLVVCLAAACEGELSVPDPPQPRETEDGADAGPPPQPKLRVEGAGAEGLRLREGPGEGGTIVQIPEGCLLIATGPPELGWLPVRWRAYEGWVYGGYLEHAEPDDPDCP